MATTENNSCPIPEGNLDLFNYLREAYAGPLNDNVWPDWLSDTIRVDDQHDGDVAGMFCTLGITVSETTPNHFQLDIRNSPNATEVLQVIEHHGGEVTTNDKILRAEAQLTLSTTNVTYLRQLACAYHRTTARGASYLDPNWAWICRRTRKSLNRLADTITEFRQQRRHGIFHP